MIKNYDKAYINRLLKDFIKILIFDNKRSFKMKFFMKGIVHGIFNRYGKLENWY